ncbi:MAG: hypothetical protein IAB19_02765 [Proteobacteria bacterium]|uniref:Uncharacterized protein n=1 Tax=Candidatus Avisuccinivibrio stercorigallinarum TaxID=2840704 RepID=A0A9D9GTM5_9GAMM|nr:hypothetical protein [Candidatus Avisuccinivibrio stercorigallinarum]
MDKDILKKRVLFACDGHTAAELEREMKMSHGEAVRMTHKIRDLKLTRESVAQMTKQELYKLYYKRAPSEHSTKGPNNQAKSAASVAEDL